MTSLWSVIQSSQAATVSRAHDRNLVYQDPCSVCVHVCVCVCVQTLVCVLMMNCRRGICLFGKADSSIHFSVHTLVCHISFSLSLSACSGLVETDFISLLQSIDRWLMIMFIHFHTLHVDAVVASWKTSESGDDRCCWIGRSADQGSRQHWLVLT